MSSVKSVIKQFYSFQRQKERRNNCSATEENIVTMVSQNICLKHIYLNWQDENIFNYTNS